MYLQICHLQVCYILKNLGNVSVGRWLVPSTVILLCVCVVAVKTACFYTPSLAHRLGVDLIFR